MDELTRRELLRRAALLAGAPIALRSLSGCQTFIDPAGEFSVPAPTNGVITIDPRHYPALTKQGGAIFLRPEPATAGSTAISPILLVQQSGTYFAVGGICPHSSCELTYVPSDKQVECPCHGSRFASDGTLMQGPAATGVPSYKVTVDSAGHVLITLSDNVLQIVGGKITFPISQFPSLETVGGFQRASASDGTLLLLTRGNQATVSAMDAHCTHAACTDNWGVVDQQLVCACHGSAFKLDGHYLSGPAPAGLRSYSTTFDGTTVVITLA